MNNLKVGYAGLTHLGLNSLAATVSKGYAVVGYDENEAGVLEEMTVLKMTYTDGLLTSISSPEMEVTDIVKIIYDDKKNPIEFQVNSKDLGQVEGRLTRAGVLPDLQVPVGPMPDGR